MRLHYVLHSVAVGSINGLGIGQFRLEWKYRMCRHLQSHAPPCLFFYYIQQHYELKPSIA